MAHICLLFIYINMLFFSNSNGYYIAIEVYQSTLIDPRCSNNW